VTISRPCGEHDPDVVTAAAIGVVAFVGAMLVHEGLGHAGACVALGGRAIVFPVWTQTSVQKPAIVAAGPLANLLFGGIALAFVSRTHSAQDHLRYFAWLTAAFNLLNLTGYATLGAATGFGDWGVVLTAAHAQGFVRLAVALVAGAAYYGSLRILAAVGARYLTASTGWRWTVPPYVAAGIVACVATAMSGQGRPVMLVAVAASFGAGIGLPVLHDWGRRAAVTDPAALARHGGWRLASAIATVAFVWIGRGLSVP
jgi:hypothetical protein